MDEFRTVEDFVNLTRRTFTLPQLKQHLIDVTLDLGFRHFSLTHHVDLREAGVGENVALTNYPDAFREIYLAEKRYVNDPVVAASRHCATGFRWTEMSKLIRFSQAQLDMFQLTHRTGLGDGYAVPVHLPGEAIGACNFVTARGKTFPERRVLGAQAIGRYAFEAARQIIRRRDKIPLPGGEPRLTTREADCVLLAARGMTARESAARLGIGVQTVQTHLESARRRYGVKNTTQLVLRTVFDGTFNFSDTLN